MVAVATETTKTNHTREDFRGVEKAKRKTNRKDTLNRPAIEPLKNYPRPEAAKVVPCAVITLIRAFEAGHLSAYRVGRNVVHSGQQLIDWLEAGGKTGRVGNQIPQEGGARQ